MDCPDAATNWPVPQGERPLEPGVDPDRLREKYRRERDRRLRADANAQYPELEGALASFGDDPWVPKDVRRPPVHETVEVVIVGGGFGGLLAGAKLRNAGVDLLRIVEKGSDFGGVWYWNRYPGVQCDIESYIYMPLLEDLGYVPSQKYAAGAEIFEHCQAIGRAYDLYDDAYFRTEVEDIRWDHKTSLWTVSTDRGDELKARFVVLSPGGQHRPRLPAVPGLESFQGHAFHTSRWDYSYTGGSADGQLTGLADKRVGLIGTGATAIQCVPHLARWARSLYVFQRTPSAVWSRGNGPTDLEWAASLEPGWQAHRMENFLNLITGGREAEEMVRDGWTETMRALRLGSADEPVGSDTEPHEVALRAELADLQLMERIRSRVATIVKDPDVAELLKPYYRFLCKRPAFSDSYLEAFNARNVALVDTKGHGVDKLTEHSVVVDGQEFEVDCLIFATGFDVGRGYLRTAGFDVHGRDGMSLSQSWETGPKTFHGLFSHGYPNCLFMGNTQTGINVNFLHSLVEQAGHISYIIEKCVREGITVIEPTLDAQHEWCAIFEDKMPEFVRFQAECTPGYFNNEGQPDDGNALLASRYPAGALSFFKLLSDWRRQDKFNGLRTE